VNLRKQEDNWKLQETALDRTAWGTGFGRGCGPVAIHYIMMMMTEGGVTASYVMMSTALPACHICSDDGGYAAMLVTLCRLVLH
jgi:hypothetical protein